MILPFKQKFPWGDPTLFKEKILSGQKKHSIRENKKRRWKVGMLIHMACGVRTKFYECFCDQHRCKSTQEIKITYAFYTREIKVFIDEKLFFNQVANHVINYHGMARLAKNDGFDSIEDFFKWFDEDFEGVIIHWTDLRY